MAISPINLGNSFSSGGGTNVLGGIASGLNPKTVIDSLVAGQSSQITSLQDTVKVNNKQLDALSSLQQILTQLKTAASQLSNPKSPDTNSNVFATSSAQITSNTSQAASNFLTASVAATAAAGTYAITDISALATATTQITTTTFNSTSTSIVAASATAGKFTAGTYTIAGPAGSGTVTLTDTDTIGDVANDFNLATADTGIKATVLQTDPGVYKLVFSSTLTGGGSAFNFDLSNGTAATVSDGMGGPLSLGSLIFDAPVDGQDAAFKLNGVGITRHTNTVNDLVTGVTLNLLQDTSTQPGASFMVSVAPDASGIETAVNTFATAYNNFLTFYAQQTALTSSGTPASSAILYSDDSLRAVYSQLTAKVASIVSGLGDGNPDQLSDIGLGFFNSAASSTTPAVNNLLSVNDATLGAAITNNLSAIENIFGFVLNSSSPNLISFHNSTSQTVTSFTVDINQSPLPATYTASYTDSHGVPQTINFDASALTGGVALTAPSDSELAGLVLIYSGTGNETGITVSTTHGIAAQMEDFLTSALTANTGLLAADSTGIQTKNTTLQTQITNVTDQITRMRAQLLQKFSALEAAISSANSALNFLNAQQSAASGG